MARRVGSVLTAVVLVTSATYMLVYLYRWEWNRALVSGLFFLAAEIAIVATSLSRRLRRIEERLDRAPAADPGTLDAIQATAPAPRQPFAWLDERSRSLNVFVPVLLGAGAVLSLLAAGVERLAGLTARPALERGLAGRLDVIALPPGGLLGPPVLEPRPLRRSRPLERLAIRAFVAVAVAVGALGGLQAVDLVADATQTRSDPTRPGSSELTMAVEIKGRVAGADETAEALWVACRNVLNRRVRASAPLHLGDGVYRMAIAPAIGDHARRRLIGCLEDATLDRVSADVLELRHRPAVAVP